MRSEPARGAVPSAINLHPPPALLATRCHTVVGDASAFLRTARARMKVVADDLIKPHDPGRGGWAVHGPTLHGPTGRFGGPYQPGDPTNVVWQVGRPSKREPDWILVGPENLCVEAERVLVPRLYTCRMVQCDLEFPERTFAVSDPSCRRFQLSQLRPQRHAPTAAASPLPLWWSAHARGSSDGAVQLVLTAVEGVVCSEKDSWRPLDRDVPRAAHETDEGGT